MHQDSFYRLWDLKKSICSDIKELRMLDLRERAHAEKGNSVLRSLNNRRSVKETPVSREQRAVLTRRIYDQQREFLIVQAELEQKITAIPEYYLRLVYGLHYVDLLFYDDVAKVIGGITGGAVQILVERRAGRSVRK